MLKFEIWSDYDMLERAQNITECVFREIEKWMLSWMISNEDFDVYECKFAALPKAYGSHTLQ